MTWDSLIKDLEACSFHRSRLTSGHFAALVAADSDEGKLHHAKEILHKTKGVVPGTDRAIVLAQLQDHCNKLEKGKAAPVVEDKPKAGFFSKKEPEVHGEG